MHYKARDLVNLSVDEIWRQPDGAMTLEFDDGHTIHTTMRETIFSWYMWEPQRRYPNTPLTVDHHIGEERLGANTHLRLLGSSMWDAYDAYEHSATPLDIEVLCKIAYDVTNWMYNDFTHKLEEWVTGISILDFLDVVDHPKIRAANDSLKPNKYSIEKTYSEIKSVLLDPTELHGNPVAKAAKSGLVSMGQILQCVSARGYLTDIDSNIFPHPILRGWVTGIRSLHDHMIESRSAAKALMFAKDPLAETEYFNRRMQLQAATLRNINRGDCGSKAFTLWRVRSADLDRMAGKFYFLEDGSMAKIRNAKQDQHLVGQQIKLRTVFGCQHEDPYGFCSACFGDLALSVPRDTNIGHVSTTVLCEAVSQRVLSTKHEDGSANVDDLVLGDYEQRYIKVGTDPTTIELADRLRNQRVLLTVSAEEAKNLPDALHAKNIKDITPSRISVLTEVKLTVVHESGVAEANDVAIVPVSMGARLSSMSIDLLEYIREHKWDLTPQGDFVIDLGAWDSDRVLFKLPLKHMNMLDYMNAIGSLIKASTVGKGVKTLRDYEDPGAALVDLHDLVRSKLFVNIAHLETIIKSTMIRDADARDHNLPRPGDPVQFGSYQDNMNLRSMSSTMAYQGQAQALLDPRSFTLRNRPDHPLDFLMMG